MCNLLSSDAVQVLQLQSLSLSSAEELSALCLSALILLRPLPVWAPGLHGATENQCFYKGKTEG